MNGIICGDNLTVLPGIADNSVDLIVTDPPYGLKFMGKSWDKAVPSVDIWRECLRVLKPGAFAFVMCIPRQDCLARMIVNLEDAGFEVGFTSLYWAYASGFPKAMNMAKNISKQLDKDMKIEYDWASWKNNLNDVKFADNGFLRSLITVGLDTNNDGSVAQNVRALLKAKTSDVNVSIAERNWNALPPMLGDTCIVVCGVDNSQKLFSSNVVIVEWSSGGQSPSSQPQRAIIVPLNVQTFLCERMLPKIKAEEAQRIENGELRFWKGMNTNVLFAEALSDLKLTTLNQFKISPNSDTTPIMAPLTATSVIITKSTMECLISSMENMLVRSAGERVKHLEGAYAGWQGKPALEVVIVAMKPKEHGTYIDQALDNRKGISWLDDCRIPYESETERLEAEKTAINATGNFGIYKQDGRKTDNVTVKANIPSGRFPANLLVSSGIDLDMNALMELWEAVNEKA